MSRLKPWWPLGLAFLVTLALEAALVERKYGIFAGGFGASHVIDRPVEAGLFGVALLAAHALLIGLLYLLVRALHRRRWREGPVFLLNFLFFAVGGFAAALVAKFEALAYFSDALGFELIKSLGGGSLAQAALYVASEGALMLVVALGAVAAWWVALRLGRRWLPGTIATAGLKWRHLLWPALPLPLLLYAAGGEPDARYGLARFTAPGLALVGLGRASDFDGDGYSWFTAQRDWAPFDPARHPFVLDIPNNGVDEDGYGGDFRFAGGEPSFPAPVIPDRKHVVLVVLESTRGDSIGRRVDGRPLTPVLNGLARGGSWSREAYSHVGFTTESLKSLFGGALAPRRGSPSLFRDFRANGYRVGVFSGQAERFGGIAETAGMKENSDVFVDAETLKAERAFSFAATASLLLDGKKVLRAFDGAFGSAEGWRRPTFAYFNFQEAHFPYAHPGMPRILPGKPIPRGEIGESNRAWVERTYWNAIAYDDWLVGQLVERLKRLGVWEDTLLVVTADHGESLFDDSFLGHGHVINRQQTQIPLILSRAGIEIPRPIGLSDYRSLILRSLGAKVPERRGPVFQHISALAAPAAIGLVGAGQAWTTFQLETEEVGFGEKGRRARYSDLEPGSAEKARADSVIDEWNRQRWLARP
ncbi:MAG TPA: sulfatase-like hydrolase/transferase [Allosphingosinicella sp.]|jgi:phosphoglycerol transferase MdoB-like AlkP superfamily enzyme